MKSVIYIFFIWCFMTGCSESFEPGTFGYDLVFLNTYQNTVILKNNNDKCQVVIVPDYQGRVMTSTSNGLRGKSYGWINYDLISSNQFEEHINVFGGEDRFWLGPEGGQYSIFFKKGDDFTVDNWNTPKPIDTEPFTIVEHNGNHAIFNRTMQLTNYQGYEFDIDVKRIISMMNKDAIQKELNMEWDEQVLFVGFQSENVITNISESVWSEDNGLLSIWILGMFTPSEKTTVIIPYKDSLELNTRYFGAIDSDRLTITPEVVLFKGDGKYRCKIGLLPKNALPVFGSFDAENSVLTVVKYSQTEDTSYVNSLWEHQSDPYGGDVINSYNDGPMESGEQLGPFYELESSSAARALQPQESIKHIHQTYHFEGDFESLNQIAQSVLNMDLSEIAF